MGALKTLLLVGLLLVQLVVAACIGGTQTSRSLQDRIPKPDPTKYPRYKMPRTGRILTWSFDVTA
jgi:hypothetical protein